MTFSSGPISLNPNLAGGSNLFAFPANRQTLWQPGVTYNTIPQTTLLDPVTGNPVNLNPTASPGIPNRTTIHATLSPIGGGSDDAPQINSAMASCPAGQVVQLTAGVFNIINANIRYRPAAGVDGVASQIAGITLRGAGPGKGLSTGKSTVGAGFNNGVLTADATATILNCKFSIDAPVILNGFSQVYTAYNLASDAVQGQFSCVLAVGHPTLTTGQIVRIDQYNSLAAVATVNAAGTWTTSSTTINMSSTNPGGVVLPGMFVFNNTTQVWVGYVQSWIGTTLTLTGQAASASSGSTNSLYFSLYPYQSSDPDVWWGPNHGGPGSASRGFFMGGRSDRSLIQYMEVASTVANGDGTLTVTFTTPFHHNYAAGSGNSPSPYWPGKSVVAGQAQLCVITEPIIFGMSLENLMVYNGDNGNIDMASCAYSWIKNVESYWSTGASVLVAQCFRCEVRDSYIHESSNPNNTGPGYLLDWQGGTSDSLVENCISWYGNKVIVGQCTGGGNVFAYNYMDDAFGATYPGLPESGFNSAHMTTSHMDLFEGNYCHKFSGDSFWGNSVDITVFRNWITSLRGAWPPLNSYSILNSGQTETYQDNGDRYPIDIQAASYRQNIIGNIFGFGPGTYKGKESTGVGGSMPLFPTNDGIGAQVAYAYSNLSTLPPNSTIIYMYEIGDVQSGVSSFEPLTYQTQLITGNWDWFSQTQQWYNNAGDISTVGFPGTGTPQILPNSLYIPNSMLVGGLPPFFASSSYGNTTWPWVNPATGFAVSTSMPAKSRFENGQLNGGNYNAL